MSGESMFSNHAWFEKPDIIVWEDDKPRCGYCENEIEPDQNVCGICNHRLDWRKK